MNEVSERYGLGFRVFQKNGKWFDVRLPGQVVSFSDGMAPIIKK